MINNRPAPDPNIYFFDEIAANTAILFIEKFLRHSKGREWAGKPFLLESWEKQIIRDLFGWKYIATGLRMYRWAYIETGRGNGKSPLGSAIAAFLLLADREPGAEIFSAAAERDQARIVFEETENMIHKSERLDKLSECYRNSILVPSTLSSYRVLSSDAYTKDGLNPHGVIFDELHSQPNRELYDVLATSMGKRSQPLFIMLTTAGFDRNSICWEQHEYARQVLAGIIQDDSFYAVIYAADEKDDWTSPEVWKKANPNLGVTVKESFLAEECKKAQLIPAYQNTFRRLYLSQWTQQETRFIPMELWDEGSKPHINPETLKGMVCYGGLDLASSNDIASFELVFPPEEGDDEQDKTIALSWFWIPRENMLERSRQHRVSYETWEQRHLITVTEGNTIDLEVILRDIIALAEIYKIGAIAFDRWGAEWIQQKLTAAGITVVAFGQGFAMMAAPTSELLRLVMDRKLLHNGNEPLRWMADNAMAETDAAGNMKPSKKKSREKIDGIIALIMAISLASRFPAAQDISAKILSKDWGM